MNAETYIGVRCPGPHDGPCGAILPAKIAFTHHALVAVSCLSCGSTWRIFHHTHDPNVELTYMPFVNDHPDQGLVQITRGRSATVKREMAFTGSEA